MVVLGSSCAKWEVMVAGPTPSAKSQEFVQMHNSTRPCSTPKTLHSTSESEDAPLDASQLKYSTFKLAGITSHRLARSSAVGSLIWILSMRRFSKEANCFGS
eukprot:scaffold31078_cov64-Phaeocystis_antarctica.AAC.6